MGKEDMKEQTAGRQNTGSPGSGSRISETLAVILFLMMTIMLHIIAMKVYLLAAHTDDISIYKVIGSKILGAILVIEMILFVRFTPMRINWSALKGSREELKHSLKVSGAIAIGIIALLVGFRVVNNLRNTEFREIPLFGLYLGLNTRYLYPINIVFQEFFIKAFVQENCALLTAPAGALRQKGTAAAWNRHITVWITSIFFFILHMQYPLYYMIGALTLCVVTGYLYESWHNIWGAVLIHFTLGFLPRCLGVLQILER